MPASVEDSTEDGDSDESTTNGEPDDDYEEPGDENSTQGDDSDDDIAPPPLPVLLTEYKRKSRAGKDDDEELGDYEGEFKHSNHYFRVSDRHNPCGHLLGSPMGPSYCKTACLASVAMIRSKVHLTSRK
jgi:hypothetical protein